MAPNLHMLKKKIKQEKEEENKTLAILASTSPGIFQTLSKCCFFFPSIYRFRATDPLKSLSLSSFCRFHSLHLHETRICSKNITY